MFNMPECEKISYSGSYIVDFKNEEGHPRRRGKYISQDYTNVAINTSLVKTMEKSQREVDSEAKLTVYVIRFYFFRDIECWFFKTEEERDEEFDKLIFGRYTGGKAWYEKDGELIAAEDVAKSECPPADRIWFDKEEDDNG